MTTVRDVARVTPSKAVPNKTRRKRRAPVRRVPDDLVEQTVDKILMDAARAALRPGERIVVVSPTVVRTVNIPPD